MDSLSVKRLPRQRKLTYSTSTHKNEVAYPMLRLRVKEVAKAKGISMNKLSQRSEVSYNVVKEIYRNPYKEVTLHTINRLADTLTVPATELLEDVTVEQAQKEIQEINSKRQQENTQDES